MARIPTLKEVGTDTDRVRSFGLRAQARVSRSED